MPDVTFYPEWILALILGAAVGSFLNVVIHRLPLGESVVHPRSRCPSCHTMIAWYDNLPILSWLLLRGRCRACGVSISPRYLLVEVFTAMIALALCVRFGLTLAFALYFAFACALLAVAYIDLDHQIIPDRISLPGIVVGLAFSVTGGWPAMTDALAGALLGGGILLAVAWTYERLTGVEGMGGGDVKLLALIGAFLGWRGVLLTLLLGSLLGSAIGVTLMLARGADRKLAIPFGPFLSLGALATLFWGDSIVRWYISYAGWAGY
ncbi:MAG: prepilin peptidase [Deltaproteobacteria bacterium]|nr:prepilin peptidase [Deltaproteobacteria bacterium]